ncbi:diguanylate cyclase/phosphodiesterase [Butyrivibrio fibrisolvens]|uniref:Diguanylate cyclase/phosphodiesterase n=1 Tax=Butyrivibrio fibrisolvens TaxID=831 RepID=A0A1H9LUK8_BUTFI|nr:GGDEF domain-containing phosphodiesterase [Butyrivibrio fibrisolvens]SER14543.1 diguanylate cyclase/phosphodiesterase [Butyrivibrio fibrisolvens]
MQYNISFDICAIVIFVFVLVLFLARKNYATSSNAAYLILLVDSLVAAVSDAITGYTIPNADKVPIFFNYFINSVFFLSMNTVLFWYCYYLLRIIYKTRPFTLLNKVFLIVCGMVDVILIISNPWTKAIFYFDGYEYCSGNLKIVLYIVSFLMLLNCVFETIRNRDSLKIGQILGMVSVTVGNLFSVIFQMFHPSQLITSFTVSMALLVIYMSIQDVDNYVDPLTRAFNQQAFEDTLSGFVKTRNPFTIVTVKLQDFRKVNETAGIVAGNRILEMIASRLRNIVGKENLFYNSGTRFTVLIHDKGMDENSIISQIKFDLRREFQVGDIELRLRPQLIVVRYPDHGKTSFELEDAITYCMRQLEKSNTQEVIYADSLILKQVKRNADMDRIMREAMHNYGFKVFYQPIRDAATGEYHSCEALLRLYDEDYGFISPEEFIPRAEKSGLIIEIGEYVFEEVCKTIRSRKFEQLGIDYVEINLSAVQCIQRDLRDKLQVIMKRYHVKPEMINLEITETAAVSSSEQLLDFMNVMLHGGIRFSLDDYGSGLANMNYLLMYPFNIVKLDKMLIWKAFSQERALVALKYTIEMLKELNYEIIAEGVETKEQADGLAAMGCDKFQGFLYSKPIEKDEFVDFIRKNKAESYEG